MTFRKFIKGMAGQNMNSHLSILLEQVSSGLASPLKKEKHVGGGGDAGTNIL